MDTDHFLGILDANSYFKIILVGNGVYELFFEGDRVVVYPPILDTGTLGAKFPKDRLAEVCEQLGITLGTEMLRSICRVC